MTSNTDQVRATIHEATANAAHQGHELGSFETELTELRHGNHSAATTNGGEEVRPWTSVSRKNSIVTNIVLA